MQTYHLTQWLIFFFLYSFIGWVWESCYVSAKKHRWVNRGFLHGPILPIYGSGAVVILISTLPVREQPWLIFFLGMSAATLLEYVTGAVMERLFHVRYWDYSSQKLNLNGYICASSSICWGGFSVLLVRLIHVPLERLVLDIPLFITDIAAMLLTAAASVDLTQSFNEAMDMKRILLQLEESREQIRKMQEKVKTATEEMLEEFRQRSDELVADYRERAEKLREDYAKRAEEAARNRHSRKEEYLEWVNLRRAQKQLQLEELAERAENLLKETLPAKAGSILGEERREEFKKLKENIFRESGRMNSRTDRNFLRIAGQLRRNPTAASKKFADALEELKHSLDNTK